MNSSEPNNLRIKKFAFGYKFNNSFFSLSLKIRLPPSKAPLPSEILGSSDKACLLLFTTMLG